MIKHLTSIELDIGNSDSNRNSNRKKKFIETYEQVLLSSVHTYIPYRSTARAVYIRTYW